MILGILALSGSMGHYMLGGLDKMEYDTLKSKWLSLSCQLIGPNGPQALTAAIICIMFPWNLLFMR